MRNFLTISIILFLCGSTLANAKDKKITTVDEALGVVCGADLQIGLSVLGIRDKGTSREFQEKAMATFKNPRQKRIMNFSINDAYTYPKLPKKIYAMYRMEICYQQMIGKNIPQLLSKVMASNLTKCQNMKSNKEQFACAGNIARKYSK